VNLKIHFRNSALSGYLMAVILLIFFVGVAYAQQPAPIIKNITVIGNKNINSVAIIASSGLKIGDPLSQAALDQARLNLIHTGNFGSHHPDNPDDAVKVQADVTGSNADVNITVDENDMVQGINLTGTGPIPATTIKALLKTKEGEVLNINTLRSDVNAIQQAYDAKGYQAIVSDGLGITNGILDIPIVVGKITKIKINGLKKTHSFVVTREMKLKVGSYYNVFQLRKDLTAIYNTGLFENVEPAFSYPAPGSVELTLNIQEKRTGSLSLGLGYSSLQQLVFFANVGESNFMGRGQTVNLNASTGGIANQSSFELGFTEPWLDKKHTSLSVDAFDKAVYRFGTQISSINTGTPTSISNSYYETHKGGEVTLSRPIGDTLRAYVGVRYDDVTVPNLQLNPNDAAILQNGPLATVTLRLAHDTRDYIEEPAAGGYQTVEVNLGHADIKPVTTTTGSTASGVTGSMDYTKVSTDLRMYISPQGRRLKPTDSRQVFAFRLLMGTSSGRLPFSEQFFVGGAESLRGYQEDRYWGNNMFLSSVEFRQPFARSLTGVLFTDLGDAWGGSYENVSFSGFTQHAGFSPSLGIGFGLRVVTPIGPIRIDEGFGHEGARTHFSIGHVF
jgi:outer membrane protein insertion porin family